MTVAVSCNVSDGVILGVDSAVTVPAEDGVAKVYENAEKLFQIKDLPIGVATYGIGALGDRSIGSYLREFESEYPEIVADNECKVIDVVEGLRDFFRDRYREKIVPQIDDFDSLPDEKKPVLGLVVGGFSQQASLSEVWKILIPHHNEIEEDEMGQEMRQRDKGSFGTNWFSMFEPIRRYIKGFDNNLLNDIVNFIENIKGDQLSSSENEELKTILREHEYQIPFSAMPVPVGVEHTRFLVELVIQHEHFSVGAPVVGGEAKVGKVTYKGEKFEILE